ncbi:M56 family metallopeptidase [Edaphobacter flagellatus]|uniref:M56 family metallopeptidase n=1 Tax=Edaphobacter flagellatus TaxID=1933044 RepID=UPI0021B31C95|nr:M56 family metallopeptidase [Edaphobacter flagellatus]
MSVLGLVHAREVVALGWTLLHFCWQGVAIALLYALVDRCLAHTTTVVRYGVAMMMLGLMPVVAIATFMEQERLVIHITPGEQPMVASQVGSLHVVVAKEVPFAAPVMANGELWIASHADRFLPWIDGLWLAGVCLLALRAVGGWWRLKLLQRDAAVAIPSAVQMSFEKVSGALRLTYPVILRVSTEVISPMVMGVWRASVILPMSVATSLPAEQLEAVLAHELAHIRRWDYLCNLLQTAIECLFFFHPAVWWISKRTRELREVCCDEIAARSCADPGIYAEALLQMEEQRAERMQLAMALHGEEGTLLHRIRRVMGEKGMEQRSMSGVRIAVAGFVVAGLVAAPHVAQGLKAHTENTGITAGKRVVFPEQEKTTPNQSVSVPRVSVKRSAGYELLPQAAPVRAVASAPSALPVSIALAVPTPSSSPVEPTPSPEAGQDTTRSGSGLDYLKKMQEAGYPLDLNKDLNTIISLRSLGVTPEYAKAMAQAGFGIPTLPELIALKSVGVTPEYIAGLKSSNAAPSSFQEAISEKSVGVTPEYAKAMADLGIGTPTRQDLISLKSVGVTPGYATQLKAGGLAPTDLHELVTFRAVGITPEYAKAMASAGFSGLSAHELVSLKAQGLTPENAHWLKATFPNADLHAVKQAAVFHIDEEFVGKAKSYGFNSTDLDKLIKLKMTGLLN